MCSHQDALGTLQDAFSSIDAMTAADFATVLKCAGPHLDFATVNVSSPNTAKLRYISYANLRF